MEFVNKVGEIFSNAIPTCAIAMFTVVNKIFRDPTFSIELNGEILKKNTRQLLYGAGAADAVIIIIIYEYLQRINISV